MGYFSNATEGLLYEDHYCRRCINYGTPEKGCFVWFLHLAYNGDDDKEEMLDLLIPRENGVNQQCEMFTEKVDLPPREQMQIPGI